MEYKYTLEQSQHKYQPSGFGEKFLKLIYDEDLIDEILGDCEEMYQDRAESKGLMHARFHYYKDAFLSVRNYDLRRKRRKYTQNNAVPMIRNYIKITFRTLAKNRIYSTLNIMGLALGMAACLFISQYVDYEYSYDKFHSNHENIYRVLYQVYRGEEKVLDCAAAVPRVGPFMKESMPEVVDYARAFPMTAVFKSGTKSFREKRVDIVDQSFIEIFDYPLLHGDAASALVSPNTLVITASTANKYFGKTDVVGETLEMQSWIEGKFEITGIVADVPDNSHLKFDILVSYETLNNQTRNNDGSASSETAWGWYDFNTYVQLKEGTDPAVFDAKFDEILAEERKEDRTESSARDAYPLQPITDIHLYSNLLQESEPAEQGDGDTIFFLTIIAAFILVIAWINYINLSTAKSMERAKEVGVRKSMGAYRKQLVYQFLTEAYVLNFLALTIAVVIAFLATPLFSQLVDSNLSRSFFENPQF